MASLTEYPIPYDAIPYVVALAEDFSNSSSPISIRIALWIGRIFVLEDKDKKKIQQLYLMGSDQDNSSEVYNKMLELTKDYEWTLFFTAIRYCMYEKACERVGLIPVDTSIFDALSLDDINKKMDLYFYGTDNTEILNERVTNLKNGLPVEWTDNELERRWKRIINKDGEIMAKGKIVERVNKDGSHSWDVIVAYKDNITGKWHHRWKTTDG